MDWFMSELRYMSSASYCSLWEFAHEWNDTEQECYSLCTFTKWVPFNLSNSCYMKINDDT